MKEFYRIGETASLMGITTQTLRFYDKIGLVKPVKTDPRTGYRYYAYEQFHFIDRIKYLQSLGRVRCSEESLVWQAVSAVI